MTYEEALAYIASLEARGWRLGLDRMTEFATMLGLKGSLGEPGGPQFIHIGGTNGKGSVTAYTQSMLIESGYSTGAFFSPYVYDPRERVQIGRRLIPKNIFGLLTAWIKPYGQALEHTKFEGVTEFEFKTAMGFQFWKEMECDWVALEVGLGGRLDSTNIVTPRCSVIVSIGLDHTHILGETLEAIAAEKAGIIKPGVPVMIGEMEDGPRQVLLDKAKELGSPAWLYGRDIVLSFDPKGGSWIVETPAGKHGGLVPGLLGSKQPHNMALAIAAMDASGATKTLRGLIDGAMNAFAPGRMQRARFGERNWLLDGAHNRDSAKVLAETLGAEGKRIVLLTGMVKGHDPLGIYEELASLVDEVIFAPIDFHRAVPPSELQDIAGSLFKVSHQVDTLQEAVDRALKLIGEDDLILVTGSFYLVGEVGRLLGAKGSDED